MALLEDMALMIVTGFGFTHECSMLTFLTVILRSLIIKMD